jgi:xanthine dehydrogenase YagS FAD-binding subunit
MQVFQYHSKFDTAQPGRFLAGGTTLIDLMKLNVEQPQAIIDLKQSKGGLRDIKIGEHGLRIGALTTMAELAESAAVARDYPVIAQSLLLAASPQIRNMASMAGNLLQRTRCPYFRDVSYDACNKRNPGSGCSALEGYNRQHAVLGTSDECIATYPGDFAQAMIALDGLVETAGPSGKRQIVLADLYRSSDAPDQETVLEPGELIETLVIPRGPYRRSLYLKVRDRESYEFAAASAAVAMHLDGEQVKSVRIALGGVAYQPWRAISAEQELRGKPFSEDGARKAAEVAFADARPRQHNAFKITLGKETLVRALLQAASMEV